jgi:transcriptional regulator with XRE-family HTH domain
MSEYTDPPAMPDDERMTPAELKVVREFLGMSLKAMGEYLGVTLRTVTHWEQGKYNIPDGVRLAIEDLEARTGEFVGGIVEKLMDLPDPGVITYRDDIEYRAANPEIPFPAAWHRAVVARVAQEVPALRIAYQDEVRIVADRQGAQG